MAGWSHRLKLLTALAPQPEPRPPRWQEGLNLCLMANPTSAPNSTLSFPTSLEQSHVEASFTPTMTYNHCVSTLIHSFIHSCNQGFIHPAMFWDAHETSTLEDGAPAGSRGAGWSGHECLPHLCPHLPQDSPRSLWLHPPQGGPSCLGVLQPQMGLSPPFHQLLPWAPLQKHKPEVRRAWTLQGSRVAYLDLGIWVVWDFPGVRGQSRPLKGKKSKVSRTYKSQGSGWSFA